ncbi:MAG: hypothetical protein ACLT76_02230 [Clostridium fessum]
MDGAVKLLKELLTIRSVNGRDDEGAVAEYLCKYFEQSGISAHIQRIDATHANVLAELEGSRMTLRSSGTGIWTRFLTEIPENGRLTRRFRWNGTVFSMAAVPAI